MTSGCQHCRHSARWLSRLNSSSPFQIRATCMGGHSVPTKYKFQNRIFGYWNLAPRLRIINVSVFVLNVECVLLGFSLAEQYKSAYHVSRHNYLSDMVASCISRVCRGESWELREYKHGWCDQRMFTPGLATAAPLSGYRPPLSRLSL